MQLRIEPRVAFDTNMLLAIQRLHVDVFSEAGRMFGKNVLFAVPEQVIEETKGLAGQGRGLSKAAGIALQEIERHGVKIVAVGASNADEALAKLAEKGYFVASNDALLRKRIKGFGGKVIYLRQSRFLEKG